MITKKDWDSLALKTKRDILTAIYGSDFESYITLKKLLYEYRHNFDFDETGKKLKKVLSYIYRVSVTELYVRVPIEDKKSPTRFLPTPVTPKPTKATTSRVAPVERCRWYCDYISTFDDDVAHAWCEADSKEEARSYFLSEYWDIKEIISIHK